ncbi:hypothetical protein BCT81_00045 [Vibrio sp. 10N.261.52.A1]|nr:hypothetical protein BCT81_00045 [Vibrio sp. 10N.261.52.A1]
MVKCRLSLEPLFLRLTKEGVGNLRLEWLAYFFDGEVQDLFRAIIPRLTKEGVGNLRLEWLIHFFDGEVQEFFISVIP